MQNTLAQSQVIQHRQLAGPLRMMASAVPAESAGTRMSRILSILHTRGLLMTTYIFSIIGTIAGALLLYWLAGKLADYFDPYDYED